MSANIKDGGPAFPTHDFHKRVDGMTLRDYFAAQAMQSAYLHFAGYAENVVHWTTDGLAESAYAMADAMLNARSA